MLCNKAAVGVLTARTLKSAFIADGDLIFASDADEQICCLPEFPQNPKTPKPQNP